MIQGKRIRFRGVERSDLPLFVDWLADPEVRFGIATYLPMSMPREEQWFEATLKRPEDEQPLVIEALINRSWKVIGTCGFHNIDWRVSQAEVGILIGEKTHWDKGLGSQAMQLLLGHTFNTLNLNRAFLRVFATNGRAIRSYEKVGFVHEGRMRQADFQDGKHIDVLYMGILKIEWAS
jgi:RimJ/RimL family protein N-acetyltransferase